MISDGDDGDDVDDSALCSAVCEAEKRSDSVRWKKSESVVGKFSGKYLLCGKFPGKYFL